LCILDGRTDCKETPYLFLKLEMATLIYETNG
jgi:hypothetical protein